MVGSLRYSGNEFQANGQQQKKLVRQKNSTSSAVNREVVGWRIWDAAEIWLQRVSGKSRSSTGRCHNSPPNPLQASTSSPNGSIQNFKVPDLTKSNLLYVPVSSESPAERRWTRWIHAPAASASHRRRCCGCCWTNSRWQDYCHHDAAAATLSSPCSDRTAEHRTFQPKQQVSK